jgi:hypothetical protein
MNALICSTILVCSTLLSPGGSPISSATLSRTPPKKQIPSSEKGVFTLPLRDELIKENPMVVANQPKGTIKLEARMEFAIDLQGMINNKLLRK